MTVLTQKGDPEHCTSLLHSCKLQLLSTATDLMQESKTRPYNKNKQPVIPRDQGIVLLQSLKYRAVLQGSPDFSPPKAQLLFPAPITNSVTLPTQRLAAGTPETEKTSCDRRLQLWKSNSEVHSRERSTDKQQDS